MLAEIARVALAIGRDVWPRHALTDLDVSGTGSDADADTCPRERLAFLEAVWPRADAALKLIESAPPTAVTPMTRVIASERARRVTPRAVLEAVRSGDLAPAGAPEDTATPPAPLAARLGGRLPRRVAETAFEATHDTPANRGVKTLVAQWARDLAAVAERAEAVGEAGVATRALSLRRSLRAHLTAPDLPWRDLPLLPAVPPLPAALRGHGAYRSLHDQWRRYRESFAFDWSAPLFSLPARDTWLLYEYWCLFAVTDALREMGWRAAAPADGFALTRDGLTFSLAPGATLRGNLPGSGTLTLTYRRHFGRAGDDGTGAAGARRWHSRSHALTPDITLERAGRLLIFDAKFKTYAGKEWQTEDIRQMHSYRDAIRRGDAPAGAVTAAWLLYAGVATGPNRPVIAYPAATPDHPFGNGDVGALLLRPGDDGRPLLTEFLRRFLEA
mgnify:CR=1 FL=1|jgi:Uncharacterized conserved protein